MVEDCYIPVNLHSLLLKLFIRIVQLDSTIINSDNEIRSFYANRTMMDDQAGGVLA